jgi:hypothetical protein
MQVVEEQQDLLDKQIQAEVVVAVRRKLIPKDTTVVQV